MLESLAITGSDPYLREGSDLTIIFGLKVAPVFEAAVNRYIDEARKQHADISEGKQDYAGISIEHLTTPDLVVRCYRARLGEYFIYSNSPVAIRRSIDAHAGKVPSLAKSLDFAYIRTLYPLGDKQEDGFVFLSDPFIRSVVGPRTRIAEKRRIETVTSLEMMKNAALLYLWERPGEKVPSLDALCEAGYLDRKHLQTEPGDRLSWDAAAFAGRSERYGRVGHLTPIIELPMDKVTAREQSDYDQFRERYQNYWRRYFDPIGMRITAGRDIALSVTILPLIDNSEYNRMKSVVGGAPADLAPPKAAASAVLYTGAHLNLENPDLKMLQTQSLTMMPGSPQASVQWIGERLRFWIDDSDAFARLKGFGEAFEIPVVLGIEVKNPLGLAAFLVGVQSMIRTSAPNMIVFEPTEAYREHSFTRIRPSSEGMLAGDPDMSKAALYFGSVGRFFYLSTSLKSLHNIVDSAPSSAPAGEAASAPAATQPAVMGHFALRLGLANAQHAKEAAELYLGQATVMAEESHRQNLLLLAQTVGLGEKAVATQQQVLGYSIVSALGNVYGYDAAHDEIVGSVSGSTWEPTKASSIPDDSPLGRLLSSIRSISAHLAFTEDGLQTHLRIERN